MSVFYAPSYKNGFLQLVIVTNDPFNNILIHPSKTYTREEVKELLYAFVLDRGDYFTKEYLPRWIEENF